MVDFVYQCWLVAATLAITAVLGKIGEVEWRAIGAVAVHANVVGVLTIGRYET